MSGVAQRTAGAGPPTWREVEHEVAELLELARTHLGVDVTFLGRFDGPDRTVAVVTADRPATAARLRGLRAPREDTYCELIASGELQPVTPDVGEVAQLARLDVTSELQIGSYVGVPVVEDDGSVWGTVCGYSRAVDAELGDDAAGVLRFIADLIATRLSALREARSARDAAAATIDSLIEDGEPTMVGQPVVRLDDGSTVGVEALARFPDRPADEVFALAALGHRSTELELAAVAAAVMAIPTLPDGVWLSCNVSLRAASDPRFAPTLASVDTHRLVLEVTEHEQHEDELGALAELTRSRRRGVRIAMDDIGTGWSGLGRALRLEPEILKLDRELISGLHTDATKRALVTAVCAFAAAVDATVIAEGIETAEERTALHDLGVPLGQGWFLGRPRRFERLGARPRPV